MRDQKLYESVGKYIDKYYIDKPDDIKLDKEMKSIFDRISEFRKKKATKKCDVEEDTDIEIDESAVESFDVESMIKWASTTASMVSAPASKPMNADAVSTPAGSGDPFAPANGGAPLVIDMSNIPSPDDFDDGAVW